MRSNHVGVWSKKTFRFNEDTAPTPSSQRFESKSGFRRRKSKPRNLGFYPSRPKPDAKGDQGGSFSEWWGWQEK